ncbi:MAG: hypothetical protein LBT94_07110 [Prevotellaceae bacterium]|jgi:hypothetical protein|nr:hypothetical protein [Prevotellaceae bacterium]
MLQTSSQNIYLTVPQSEVGFIMTLAQKMGWEVETKADLLRRYISSRPQNVGLSEEEIIEEVCAIRYDK